MSNEEAFANHTGREARQREGAAQASGAPCARGAQPSSDERQPSSAVSGQLSEREAIKAFFPGVGRGLAGRPTVGHLAQ